MSLRDLFKKSLKWAKKGDAESQCYVGNCYRVGEDTKINYDCAVNWYICAMEQNYAEAYFQMGHMHETLQKTQKKSLEDALWFYISPRRLGLENNKDKDSVMALCYYKKAEELGYEQASANVERLSRLVFLNLLKEPTEWINDTFASKAKSTVKKVTNNAKIKANPKVKLKLKDKRQFKKSLKMAKKGIAMYQCNIGTCYCNGKGVAQDYEQGIHWYRQAVNQNYPNAYYYLGICYEKGNGVPVDLGKALQLYKQAEELGCVFASEAIVRISSNAGLQRGILKDLYETGKSLYDSSSKKTGNDKYKAIDQAIVYLKKSAETGNALAMNLLGYIYCFEEYYIDYNISCDWSLKAAKQGNAKSQYRVGRFYEKGIGFNLNISEAKKWYEKAAAQGDSDAIAALKRLNGAEVAKLKAEAEAARKSAEAAKAKVEMEKKTTGTGVKATAHTSTKTTMDSTASKQNNGDEFDKLLGAFVDSYMAMSPEAKKAVLGSEKSTSSIPVAKSTPIAKPAEPVKPKMTEEDLKKQKEAAKKWYSSGWDFVKERDYEEAYRRFLKAAEMGYVEGMFKVAQINDGEYRLYKMKQDPDKAFYWYKQAAECGYYLAKQRLAYCYRMGYGVVRDIDKALQIYRKIKDEKHAKECLSEMKLLGITPSQSSSPSAPTSVRPGTSRGLPRVTENEVVDAMRAIARRNSSIDHNSLYTFEYWTNVSVVNGRINFIVKYRISGGAIDESHAETISHNTGNTLNNVADDVFNSACSYLDSHTIPRSYDINVDIQ